MEATDNGQPERSRVPFSRASRNRQALSKKPAERGKGVRGKRGAVFPPHKSWKQRTTDDGQRTTDYRLRMTVCEKRELVFLGLEIAQRGRSVVFRPLRAGVSLPPATR